MKKLTILFLTAILLFSACANKKVYRPSHFPESKSADFYSYAIPFEERSNTMYVRVRLNDGPQFQGVWDSGCSLPLKISKLEANSLVKDGTLSQSDYRASLPVKVANGQTSNYAVYMLKSISFVDDKGVEHTLTNIPAVIDDNVGTDILIGLPVMQALGSSHEVSQFDHIIFIKE
jgi:hypothetical protein